jgi:hypothetical protein
VPVCLKPVLSVICAAGVVIWTCAVTCHADCIRLLAGRGMNICHKVWSLSTVIPIHCTTNTRSCCSLETQEKSNIWCWPCPLDFIFIYLQGQQSYNYNTSGANFCHDNCKNLAKMRQAHQDAVELRKKMMTLKWNNCALFYIFVTVIQIMNMI